MTSDLVYRSLYDELAMAGAGEQGDPASQGSAQLSFRSPVAPVLNATLVGNNADSQNNGGQRASSSSSSSSSFHANTTPRPTPANVNIGGASALRPVFHPPMPGQLTVAQATLTHDGIRRSIPVFMYTSTTGDHQYVYPVTRALLGTVLYTPEHLARCEFHYCHEDSMSFCARRADLPTEMVQSILVALETNGGGAQLDLARLQAWQDDL